MEAAGLLLVFFSLFSAAFAQADLWQPVKTQPDPRPERISISQGQVQAIRNVLGRSGAGDWPCGLAPEDAWTGTLIFEGLPVSSTDKVLLVETGPGCARGGQGANGAMWVVRFQGPKPVLLATPKQDFNGWLYAIQTSASHGLRDIVLGWHMGASETDLAYFRFDGTHYKQIGTAELTSDADGNPEIIPAGNQK